MLSDKGQRVGNSKVKSARREGRACLRDTQMMNTCVRRASESNYIQYNIVLKNQERMKLLVAPPTPRILTVAHIYRDKDLVMVTLMSNIQALDRTL